MTDGLDIFSGCIKLLVVVYFACEFKIVFFSDIALL